MRKLLRESRKVRAEAAPDAHADAHAAKCMAHTTRYSWVYALEFMLGLGIHMGMQWPGVGGSPSLRVALSALALPQRYRHCG